MARTRSTRIGRTMHHGAVISRASHAGSRTRRTARRADEPAFRARGFTLVEVLITVAIVAILVSIALPSYSGVMTRLNRGTAQQFMMDVASKEEQTTLDLRGYTATIGSGGLGLTPTNDVAANYTFSVALTGNDCLGVAVSGPAFVVTATAIGSQAGDGNLCLDSRNNKAPAAKWGS